MASSVESSAAGSTKTPAQLLAEQHEAHHATVEEIPDEEDLAHPPPSHGGSGETDNTAAASNGVMSAKAAGKQKATEKSGVIDTQDEEAFPTLGAPTKSATKAPGWGSKGSLKTSSSPAISGTSTPKGAASRGPAISGISMPNKNRDHLDVDFDDINKSVTMKKVLDDAKRRHKVITSVQEMEVGRKKVLRFTAEGPQRTGVRDALLEISKAVSIEKIFKLEVSPNVSATIIGRGGANIRKLQADHGVRINIERDQPSSTGADEKVDVVEIKGDYAGARTVFNKISSMKKEMQPKIDLPLKGIAPELYPFIASRHADEIQRLQDVHDLSIDVPQYHTWRAQPPPRAEPRPTFVPHGDSFITLSGEQEAAAQARQVLEAIADRIAQELILEELTCEQVLHPYIVGERGMDPLQFLEQTGCAIILPPGHHETDDIHIIGPEDRIEEGRNLVEQLMSQKYNRPVDIGRQFANAPRGAERHSRALAQYLQKKALEREFMSAHNSEVIFPVNPNAAPSWSVISSDQQKAVSAKNDLMKIAQAFPTSRIQLLEMDPYYHPHIEDMFAQQLQEEHGVFMIVPDESEDDVILVYEAPNQDGPFALPRQKPSAAEQKEFERALMAAQEFLFSSIPSREIAASEMPIPRKHHDRVRRFVNNEQQNASSKFPILFDFGETKGKRSKAQQAPENVSMRGPSQDDIEAIRQKIEAFLLEVEQDEKERDYVTTCDFPEKFVKNLVGKNGANIKALRDKYDVEIQTGEAGKVSIQGPQKKADACKQEIMRLGKQYEDEVSYSITVERKLHGELIGKGGETLNKLQSKVNNEVRIDFPRAPRPGDASDNGSDAGGVSQKQGPNEIRIRGPRAKADKVREELLSLAQYLQDNSHVATVSVDKEQIPSLIGKQGAELNKLREETGAAIDIPDRSAASERVEITIKGTKAAVDKARQEIARKSKAFDSIVTKTVTVDKKWHRDLIGTGGANIQNIVTVAGGPAKSAEAVQFPKKGEDGSTLTIKGTSDVVEKIVSAIQSFVEDKEGQITDTVDVPQDQHRLLIGTGGNIRKSIEQQFNVLIDIPRRDSNKTDVKIAGRPEGVAQAKEHIISLTKQPEGTTIMVPRSVHHTVADGGRIFRDLSRQGIKIDHKGQQPPKRPQADGGAGRRANNADAPLITDDPADEQVFSFDIVSQNAGSEGETGEIPWVLIGGREVTQENIAKAQKRIEEAMQRASEPRYTGYLRLADPRLHRHVIGRGGSTINSIRKQTDCDIQVPGGNKSQNNGEEITIVGSEENVLLAKDLILQEIEKGN